MLGGGTIFHISKLGKKFGDLEVASEISVLDDLNSVIASVSYERKTVEENNELAQEEDSKDVAE